MNAGGPGSPCVRQRPLSVGAEVFDGFNFVAFGHLHQPQTLGACVHYAGSLQKNSLCAACHENSVSIIELDGGSGCGV